MSALRIVAPLALLTASLLATSSPAIEVITDAQTRVRNQIAQQLGENKSYALVIGISEFDNPGWDDLKGVSTEYDQIKLALEAHKFKVVGESTQGYVDHQSLTKKITEFLSRYGKDPDNRLVIYIATHGYADPNNPEPEGYLVASDGALPKDGAVDNAFSVNQLDLTLRGIAAQHVFLFFNSCFSAAMMPAPTRAAQERVPRTTYDALSPETAKWTLDLLAHNARLVLTAGNASQTVPDENNPFYLSVVDALNGEGDLDGDGLILGTEIAQYVRGRVARATRLAGHANDPIFAVIPKRVGPPGADTVDYTLQGDFIFLAKGPKQTAKGETEQEAMLKDKSALLTDTQYLACVDCPTMIEIPGTVHRYALSTTEVTYAQWDACFRESICRRYVPDDGLGRGDRPVSGVTWLDALEYTTWLNTKPKGKEPCDKYRLPTQAEWQAAALFSTHGEVTWESAVADTFPVCWGCGAGQDGVAALRTASSPANAAGLYDMVGNVWEWVDDGMCKPDAVDDGTCKDGQVMGGSYATRIESLPLIGKGGFAPRTGNVGAWSSPTVGFRVACD
jgi:hypothetical protein